MLVQRRPQCRQDGQQRLVIGIARIGKDGALAAAPAARGDGQRCGQGAAEADVSTVQAQPPRVVLAVVRAVASWRSGAGRLLPSSCRTGPGKDVPMVEVLGLVPVVVHAVGVDPGREPFPVFVRQLHVVMARAEDLGQLRDLASRTCTADGRPRRRDGPSGSRWRRSGRAAVPRS